MLRAEFSVLPLVLAALAFSAAAREIPVEPDPAGAPVLAKAIESAADGDTLLIRKGLYRETLVVTKALRLVGDEGAVLDPSEPFKAAWEAAPQIGKGVYRAASERRPFALMLDGKLVAEIDERRAKDEGPWFWKTLLASGPPLSKLRFVRALWIYRASEKKAYLHLADDADPGPLAWSALFTREPVLAFRGATGASATGLTFAHGHTGVAFQERAARCTLSRCVVGPFEKQGVLIADGASECLVENNRVFRGSLEDWTPEREDSKERYEIWKIHKSVGFYDRVGVQVFRSGSDNRIHANQIYETFDGINVGDWDVENLDLPLTHPEQDKGTEIWENSIERTRDSGMELGAGCIDVKVHHNTLRQTHGGLRFKLPRVGPLFIYRNLLVDGSPFNIWYSMDDSPAEAYVYHNTIIGGGEAALVYSSFSKGGHQLGAPKWSYFNNLFAAKGFFRNRKVNAPVNFTADYNLVVGGNSPWPDDKTKEPHSRYVDDAGPLTKEYHPLPGSPAIDAGLDLSTAFHGKALPGCEGRYFKGAAPDLGAFESE
jgi:hypothetical protein